MKRYSISQLANAFDLSRSTLLYYDRIGLLCAAERTSNGYRRYTCRQYHELERICMLRNTGLPLNEIKLLLKNETTQSTEILETRLKEIELQIVSLRKQQHSIVDLLQKLTSQSYSRVVDKKMWTQMLATAGMDEDDMMRWHAEFESNAPSAHHEFLLSLGISPKEAQTIRRKSRAKSRL